MDIIVTSKNPVKLNATSTGFKRCFPNEQISLISVSVPSGVPDQPMTEEETLKGAKQ